MLTFHELVFDDIITGTGTTWYTASGDLAQRIGKADALVFQACTSFVSGTSPSLTVTVQHSPEGEDGTWKNADTSTYSGTVTNGGAVSGSSGLFFPNLLGFIRLGFFLTGTSPQCRVKLFVTGRSWGSSSPGDGQTQQPLRAVKNGAKG